MTPSEKNIPYIAYRVYKYQVGSFRLFIPYKIYRLEIATEEGYPLTALLQRSHPMAERIAGGEMVRVAALRGSVLPDPLGANEPEYFL